jgi:2-phospho-L-lactate transferase/gluconeogenesis factor (CofD/UPF0052 family)
MIVALAGGVGGARLAVGLAAVLPPHALTIVVNTGDDFEHLGFTICPDIDTVMYTLAGLNNATQGWGRRDESWHFMETLGALGGETWFRRSRPRAARAALGRACARRAAFRDHGGPRTAIGRAASRRADERDACSH